MSIPVSQAVYDSIVAQRDTATAGAANAANIIATETTNQAAFTAQAADLQAIVDELEVA